MSSNRPRVVIIGAGFGGLQVARNLVNESVDILLIDRNNYHTFTPLLYQVATCGLDPSEIAYPIRSIFRKKRNLSFLLADVEQIMPEKKQIRVQTYDGIRVEDYDYLIIAAGSVTNFFNNEDLSRFGFGMKDLRDSIRLRDHILKLFERAAWTNDSSEQQAMTTMVVVGGGPTGLETAGALYELYNHVLTHEYNRSNAIHARVILVEALDTLLRPYPERLQDAALRQLESLGVEVLLGEMVKDVYSDRVILSSGQTIRTYTLVWAAGVKGSPLTDSLNIEVQRGNRIPVTTNLSVVGLEDVYAIGDVAYLMNPKTEMPYPQVIPVAQQQGDLAAKNILRRIRSEDEQEFKYRDRGIMATIGRRRAVAWPFYKLQLTGFFAWITWLGLHLVWLMGMRNRLKVFINWLWNYMSYDRSVRIMLTNDLGSNITRADEKPQVMEQHTPSQTTVPESTGGD